MSDVFPASAGMSRVSPTNASLTTGVPRVRGDEPEYDP